MKCLFQIEVNLEEEDRRRDEFGWLEGFEPGCDRWIKKIRKLNVIGTDENIVKAVVVAGHGSGYRNVRAEILGKIQIDYEVKIS